MEHNSYYKKGGETQPKPKPKTGKKTKPKEPQIIRGWVDDEPYEYGDGGNIPDYEMYSKAGNKACHSLVQKVIKKIEGQKRVTKDEVTQMIKNGIKKIEEKYEEVTDSEPSYHISYLVNRALQKNGYSFETSRYEFAKGGAIYKGNKVKIKETGKTMKVTDISKGKKGYVEFTGSEGTFLKGDINKMAKGGGVKLKRGTTDLYMIKYISELASTYNKKLTQKQYQSLRNKMYDKGVSEGYFYDTDENYEKFDKKLGQALKVDWDTMAKGGSTEGCWCYEIGGL